MLFAIFGTLAVNADENFTLTMPNSITPDEMEEYIMNAAAEITGESSSDEDKTEVTVNE